MLTRQADEEDPMNPIARTAAAAWRFEISMWRAIMDGVYRVPVLHRTLDRVGRAVAAYPYLLLAVLAVTVLAGVQAAAGVTVAAAVSVALIGVTLVAGIALTARR